MKPTNETEQEYADLMEEAIQLILTLLVQPKMPEDLKVSQELLANASFQKLYDYLLDLRRLSAALCKGDLHKFAYSKGFVLSNLKALQSNLRHLTWQTKKVAEGDFSQRVDFLGEFSDSFNEMTVKLQDSSLQLRKLASLDALTQLPNRLALEEFLQTSFESAQKQSSDISILIMDIDHFKVVNDTYGHTTGDKVLIKISEVLDKQFRATDIFARYGGEEFMAALPGTDLNAARNIAQRALRAVQDTEIKIDEDMVLFVTISIGVSSISPWDNSYHDIIKRSDEALYQAKGTGRNKICARERGELDDKVSV